MADIKKLLRCPNLIVVAILRRCFSKILKDEIYLKWIYYFIFKTKLNIEHPETFNEKLQWLKLNDKRMLYTKMVDKYEAKEYLKNIIDEKYLIPTLGVWDAVADIKVNELPNSFVLKTTHDSGGVVICSDKETFSLPFAIKKLSKSMNHDYSTLHKEYPYKNIKRRIIAEEFLGNDLQDYRVYCFNGIPKLIYSYTNKSELDGSKPEPTYCDIFDTNWKLQPFHQNHKPRGTVDRPKCLDEMLMISERVSKGMPFLRVDFYECGGRVYIGELTLFPGAGFSEFHPKIWDKILGEWIKLPK